MITTETLTVNGITYVKHASDKYMLIQEQTGEEYASAIDLVPCKYTYTESTKLRPVEIEPQPLEAEHELEIRP